VLGDPPKGEEHVHTRLQRGCLKDFLGEVSPVREEHGFGVSFPGSVNDVASEISDGDRLFVRKTRDAPLINKGVADKGGSISGVKESVYNDGFAVSLMDHHRHDRSVAAKWGWHRLFGRVRLSRGQSSLLSILRFSSTWFILTLSFSTCPTNYRKGFGLRRHPAFQKSSSLLGSAAQTGASLISVSADFDDLFQPPRGVPPPGEHDFRIHTDPTGKILHRQPYRMTQSERKEFEVQIKKLLANGWVTDSHSRYAAPIIFVKKPDATL